MNPWLGRERLPLEGQHPVALQVAEGAVVAEDVEAVARCARRRGPVGAGGSSSLAHVGASSTLSTLVFGGIARASAFNSWSSGSRLRGRVERRGNDASVSPSGSKSAERHLGSGLGGDLNVGRELLRRSPRVSSRCVCSR